MKPMSTSIYTFEKLIKGGYLYVDKTEYIYNLVSQPYGLYFLSRPRRFGKSLLLSTLKSFFLGHKELFKGLSIYDKPLKWQRYPIIHIDLGDRKAESALQLDQTLCAAVNEQADIHGIQLSSPDATSRFRELILSLAADGEKVVILVDEYDKPILSNTANPQVNEILKTLKAFYAVIKATEPYQRFVLLTGVSKFSKVSIFFDLNNLTDLTMAAPYGAALGYTQAELETNFAPNITELASKEGMSYAEILVKIKSWYNGYRFHYSAETVYNPVSLTKCLDSEEFSNYWFETGTPTFLLDVMRKQDYSLAEYLQDPVTELAFTAYDVDRISPTPLLIQTGYLTIISSELEGDTRLYQLGFPNREVEQAFGAYLIDSYSGLEKERVGEQLIHLGRHLKSNNLDGFFSVLHAFFAGVPNTITLRHEKYYQTILFVTLRLLGLQVEVEVSTNKGRIDAVLGTPDRIYIIEFKLNGTAEEALEQIRTKGYIDSWRADGREIICIGVAFDPVERNIGNFIWITAD
jgi:hypothetical protein